MLSGEVVDYRHADPVDLHCGGPNSRRRSRSVIGRGVVQCSLDQRQWSDGVHVAGSSITPEFWLNIDFEAAPPMEHEPSVLMSSVCSNGQASECYE